MSSKTIQAEQQSRLLCGNWGRKTSTLKEARGAESTPGPPPLFF